MTKTESICYLPVVLGILSDAGPGKLNDHYHMITNAHINMWSETYTLCDIITTGKWVPGRATGKFP
jgi:hypothetical protein